MQKMCPFPTGDPESIAAILQQPLQKQQVPTKGVCPSDPKSYLNTFCQRYCKRPITKQDIIYAAIPIAHEFQASVTLHCMDSLEFVGEVAPTEKEAEQLAAKQALLNYTTEMSLMEPNTKKAQKRKAPGDPDALAIPAQISSTPSWPASYPAASPSPLAIAWQSPVKAPVVEQNPKMVLNTALMRILHRPLVKGEIQFETVNTTLGVQATITLPCLPGEWAGCAWAGEVAPQKKEAEENAARIALQQLAEEPSFAQSMAATGPKAPKVQKTLRVGTPVNVGAVVPQFTLPSWGSGKCAGGKAMGAIGAKGGPYGKGAGVKGAYGGAYGAYGGYGKASKGKGGKADPSAWGDAPRQRITTDMVTGTVADWKGAFGWVQLDEDIGHPMAQRNRGRVYLHQKDWLMPDDPPTVGQPIAMHVYTDHQGMGAEEAWAQ